MKVTCAAKCVWWSLCVLTCCERSASGAQHYVFFNRERERISESSFVETREFKGAQLKYTWRELEAAKDQYDFGAIEHDLAVLNRNGKKLFIQLQDSSFDPRIVLVPRYLLNDDRYGGGAARQYKPVGSEAGVSQVGHDAICQLHAR
jgi:hypothetical protein